MNTTTNTVASPPQPPDAETLTTDAHSADVGALMDGLRDLMLECGKSKNDQVDVLITALIGHGINLGPKIIAVAKDLGYDGQHAGIRLHHGNGDRWRRDPDGTYRNLL